MSACLTRVEKANMVDESRRAIIWYLNDKVLNEASKKKTTTQM